MKPATNTPTTPMTLRELAERSRAGNAPEYLSLREVSEITRTPYKTIERWVYQDRRSPKLPTIPVGPTCRPRVLTSVVLRMFWGDYDARIPASR